MDTVGSPLLVGVLPIMKNPGGGEGEGEGATQTAFRQWDEGGGGVRQTPLHSILDVFMLVSMLASC